MTKDSAVNALLVEDNPDDATRERQSLEDLGFTVTWTRNSREACDAISSGEWDVMVFDFRIDSEMTGVELARIAKVKHPAARIMFISGLTMVVRASLNTQEREEYPIIDKGLRMTRVFREVLQSNVQSQTAHCG